MSKHTPAEWKIGDTDREWAAECWDSVASYSTIMISAAGRPDPIALVVEVDEHFYGSGRDCLQANAHLIAAAPDLLSAVTLLLANIDTCGLDIDPAYRATAIKARNKALGRTDPPKAA